MPGIQGAQDPIGSISPSRESDNPTDLWPVVERHVIELNYLFLQGAFQSSYMNLEKAIAPAVILALIISLVPFISDSSDATTVYDDTFYYSLDEANSQATVTGLVDDMIEDIPKSISYNSKTYQVVAIGANAFKNHDLVGNMNTNSVSSIGAGAFQGASFTGNLTLSSSMRTIGDSAFQNTDFTGNLTMSSGLTSIGNSAFRGTDFTGNLKLPSTVKTIGSYAFYGSTFTGNLSLPASLTSVGDYAFAETDFTGNLTLPTTLTAIGSHAFYKTDFTGNLTIGNSVTSIGDYAFAETQFTGNLSLGSSVKTIGNYAFANTDFTGNLKLGNKVTSVGNYAFYNADFTGNLDLGDSVQTIGEGAFKNCSFKGDFDVPSSATSIGNQAFTYNSGVTSVTINASTTVIGAQSFYGFTFYQADGVTVMTQTSVNLGGHTFKNDNGKMILQGSVTPTPTPTPTPTGKYTITVISDTPGWGEVSGSGTYNAGESVKISASAKSGYKFVGWSDGVTSSTRTVTVTSDANYNPIFEPNEVTQPEVIKDYSVVGIGVLMFIVGIILLAVFALLYVRYNSRSKKEGL